ncbi:hypothetical protein H8F24_04870 [Synechococcus sp. CBW1002]|jgi:cyanophycin synthetase|uniref:Mur ligase family protein n=1 Tax=Synechococcus sp. CBW1002 TaxID=1353134 RepID=UPI0018CF2ECB|nr:Mur ligase family protein [Synechococcus sp. CBW1002]QPN60726.1 hypothetical protein H8F24_04870 [Synechococcus sp. CBW1002]
MKVARLRFLRKGNMQAPCSGAVIEFTGVDPAEELDAERLARWLTALPTSLRLSPADCQGPLVAVLPRLLLACSEHARLEQAPVRLLHQGPTTLCLWLPVDDPKAAKAVAALSIHIVEAVRRGNLPDATTTNHWNALRSRFWNQTHAHLARAANQLGIPFALVDKDWQRFLQLGQGCHLRLFHETLTDRTPLFARSATNKEALHNLLKHRGVPLPAQETVETLENALAAAERIGWPVVLKPASGGKGRGVWVGLSDPMELRQAWQSQEQSGEGRQLLQQNLTGADHRLLVVMGKLLAVAQRQPATLISDGLLPLHRQIAVLNADPERGVGYERLKNRVPVDGRLDLILGEQGFTLASVPPAGTRVQLSRTANISQGGTAIDCSARVHPDNRRLAEDIAQLIGTDVVGLDLISRDIGVSWREGGTWLLEANLSAGLRPHLLADPDTDLCQRIVRLWMGEHPQAGRIPIALITGSVGKTTTSRMLAHLLLDAGKRVGLCSSTGVELDGQLIKAGDLAGGGPAQWLLQDRRIEALVAEVARGGILMAGLGIESADVTAVLNVLDNHVGMDGIRSREDLARIKAVVAQAAEKLLVVNADDPLTLGMAQNRDPATVALVSEDPGCSAWHAHRRAGHLVASYSRERQGNIKLHHQDQQLLSIALREIPASDDGAVGTIATAAAFSAAQAIGLGLKADQIIQGLRNYGLKASHRRGRFEILMREPWQVVLTWADGPEAMASLSSYALAATEAEPCRRMLLCSAPDTRPDAFLQKVGQATWGFDLVVCAAWSERRNRTPDMVPALLAKGVRSLGPDGPAVLESGLESEAVALLAEQIRPGDFCVVSTFESEIMREKLLAALS